MRDSGLTDSSATGRASKTQTDGAGEGAEAATARGAQGINRVDRNVIWSEFQRDLAPARF